MFVSCLNKKAWCMVFLEDYQTAITGLKKALCEDPSQSKTKYRLVISLIFKYRQTCHEAAVKEKTDRELKTKILMTKIILYWLKKTAKKMNCPISFCERPFTSEPSKENDQVT